MCGVLSRPWKWDPPEIVLAFAFLLGLSSCGSEGDVPPHPGAESRRLPFQDKPIRWEMSFSQPEHAQRVGDPVRYETAIKKACDAIGLDRWSSAGPKVTVTVSVQDPEVYCLVYQSAEDFERLEGRKPERGEWFPFRGRLVAGTIRFPAGAACALQTTQFTVVETDGQVKWQRDRQTITKSFSLVVPSLLYEKVDGERKLHRQSASAVRNVSVLAETGAADSTTKDTSALSGRVFIIAEDHLRENLKTGAHTFLAQATVSKGGLLDCLVTTLGEGFQMPPEEVARARELASAAFLAEMQPAKAGKE